MIAGWWSESSGLIGESLWKICQYLITSFWKSALGGVQIGRLSIVKIFHTTDWFPPPYVASFSSEQDILCSTVMRNTTVVMVIILVSGEERKASGKGERRRRRRRRSGHASSNTQTFKRWWQWIAPGLIAEEGSSLDIYMCFLSLSRSPGGHPAGLFPTERVQSSYWPILGWDRDHITHTLHTRTTRPQPLHCEGVCFVFTLTCNTANNNTCALMTPRWILSRLKHRVPQESSGQDPSRRASHFDGWLPLLPKTKSHPW